MSTVRVLLFAAARDLAGADAVTVPVAPPVTVGGVRRGLAVACPALAGLCARSRLAVDLAFADDADPVRDGAEVALIPPVSGG